MGYRTSYVVVTAIRDALGQLGELVDTIVAQEWRPALWVLVDEGHHEPALERVEQLHERMPWIHGLRLPRTSTGESRGYSQLLTLGFRHTIELAEAEGISPQFVVNLDADVRCAPHVLAELIARSEGDRTIGIASCLISETGHRGKDSRYRDVIDGLPRGDLRVWRRTCLEEVGMNAGPRWAETTGLWARNRGWRTPVFEDLVVEAAQPERLEVPWDGLGDYGAEGWEIGLHPLLMADEAVVASVQQRDLRGLAIIAGYLRAALQGKRRSHDPELREYFGEDRLKHRARTLLSRVPVVGSRLARRR